MKTIDRRIGFVGAGSMGEAMIGAIINAGLLPPSSIVIFDVRQERLDELKKAYGLTIAEYSRQVYQHCDLIVLAVKPQQMDDVLADIGAQTHIWIQDRKLIISIAAGYPLRKIEAGIYASLKSEECKQVPIIRVMPNTPALVRAGISGMSPNRYAGKADLDLARSILEAMGDVVEFQEEDLHAVTALSGSGPAYVFYLAESMIKAGIRCGLAPEDSSTLAIATINGAAKLMAASADDPQRLRQKVTSPGGTTEAAFRVLESGQTQQSIVDAISAAWQRSKELGS